MLPDSNVLKAIAVSMAILAVPAQAAQRTFVASYGSDANTATSCGFANPCRGFTAAHSVTDPNGEIVALDSAGYGPVTITKSITIAASPGFYAGISASSGNAVTIATAGVNVVLRGLNINGTGATHGIFMTAGSKLSVEGCVISNFSSGDGVHVDAMAIIRVVDSLLRENGIGVRLANGATGTISTTKLLGNLDHGLWLIGATAGTTTAAAVSDSVISGGHIGIEVGAQAAAIARAFVTNTTIMNHDSAGMAVDGSAGTQSGTIGNSMVTGNAIGLYNLGGTFESLGNNIVRWNTSNSVGTITTVSGS